MDDSGDLMWLAIAAILAGNKGTCARRNVGAVLLAGGRFREAGWNGMERAADARTCEDGACPRGQLSYQEQPAGVGYSNCVYFHAEYNVAENYRLSNNIRNLQGWAKGRGIVVYSSSAPCEDCQKYSAWSDFTLIWES